MTNGRWSILLMIVSFMAVLFYHAGYRKGADYGVATSNLMWENDVYSHGCGEYYVENREAKFRWKDCHK